MFVSQQTNSFHHERTYPNAVATQAAARHPLYLFCKLFFACGEEENLLACAAEAIGRGEEIRFENCSSALVSGLGQTLVFFGTENSIDFFNIKIVEGVDQEISTDPEQIQATFNFQEAFLPVGSGSLIISNIDREKSTFDAKAEALVTNPDGTTELLEVTAENVSFTE